MPSPLLEAVAWTWLALSFASAIGIVVDLLVRGNRQSMRVMEWVWPITALYLGPVALWAYLRYGRLYAPAYVAAHPAPAGAVFALCVMRHALGASAWRFVALFGHRPSAVAFAMR